MKISIVHSYYASNVPSGENIVVNSQISALVNAGHEVQLVSRKTISQEPGLIKGLKIGLNVATGSGEDPTSEIESFGPDIVHVHNLFPNFGTRWLPKLDIPIVATLHNFRTICSAGTLLRNGQYCDACIQKTSFQAVSNSCYRGSKLATIPLAISTYSPLKRSMLLSHSSKLVVLSPIQEEVFRNIGVEREKLVTIPNFTKTVETLPGHRSGWLFVGRLSVEKGIDKLISNWPTNESLTVYGDGPLKELVVNSPNEGVSYGGILEHSQVSAELSKAMGLIFPSECFEAGPVIYLEALAAGLPVIAKQGNAAAEDVHTFNTGAIFNNWADIQESLNEVRKRQTYFSHNALRRFKSHFSEEQYVKRIENLYNSLIESSKTTETL